MKGLKFVDISPRLGREGKQNSYAPKQATKAYKGHDMWPDALKVKKK